MSEANASHSISAVKHSSLHSIAASTRLRAQTHSHPKINRSLVDSIWAITWVTDMRGACTSITQSWCAFTGRSLDQSVGAGWFRNIHPLDLQRVQTELDRAHHTHQSMTLEYRLRRADGHYNWIQHNGLPQFDQNHHFTGFINIAIDVVGIQRLEQKLVEVQSEVRRQRDLTHALLDVMAVANSQANPWASLDFIMDQALHMLQGQIGVLYRYSPESNSLRVLTSVGLPSTISTRLNIRVGQGTAGRAIQQNRPVALDSLEGEVLEIILAECPDLWENVIDLTQSVARSLAAPLHINGVCVGVLAIYRRDSQNFNEDEVSLLSALSAQATLVIHSNLQLFAHHINFGLNNDSDGDSVIEKTNSPVSSINPSAYALQPTTS